MMEIEVRKCFEMILFYLLFVGIGVDRYKYCLMSKVIHRFIRSANLDSNIHNRVANRFDPFKNTQVTLEDPVNNRTLTLIGTTNSSTTLAHRTRLLLDKIKPDAVYVQTCPTWWKYAQHVNVKKLPYRLKPRLFSAKPARTFLKVLTNLKTI